MSPYIWAGDDESTGMTSFAWQDVPAQTAPAKVYRVKFTYDETGEETVIEIDHPNEQAAQIVADELKKDWDGIYTFKVYEVPAITAEMDLETRAGSPGCVDGDDLLGVKPPC